MFTKINNIKEINVGDTIRWTNGAYEERRETVFAADDGSKSIKLGKTIWPVSALLESVEVETVRDYKCHICGCEGGH